MVTGSGIDDCGMDTGQCRGMVTRDEDGLGQRWREEQEGVIRCCGQEVDRADDGTV